LDQLLPPLEAVANKQIKESQARAHTHSRVDSSCFLFRECVIRFLQLVSASVPLSL
jgi:hypothetical protein